MIAFSPKIAKTQTPLILAAAVAALTLVGCSQTSQVSETSEPSGQTQTVATTQGSAQAETLENLQAAYNGEFNAHLRYTAYAKKADEEGYKQVAKLFRAAALAEQIHRDNHAEAIRKMGAEPKAEQQELMVKSTRDNLQAAIDGESYERDKMYPEFISKAESINNKDAVQTFKYAQEAEAQHASYYQEALNNLDNWQESSVSFYVCPECGYTTNQLDFANCPECGEEKNNFKEVV
jgi:rubrerythrin